MRGRPVPRRLADRVVEPMMVAPDHAEKYEQSNLSPEPLVLTLGEHLIACPICNARGRASCPDGRTLADAAALAATIAYERRRGWRA